MNLFSFQCAEPSCPPRMYRYSVNILATSYNSGSFREINSRAGYSSSSETLFLHPRRAERTRRAISGAAYSAASFRTPLASVGARPWPVDFPRPWSYSFAFSRLSRPSFRHHFFHLFHFDLHVAWHLLVDMPALISPIFSIPSQHFIPSPFAGAAASLAGATFSTFCSWAMARGHSHQPNNHGYEQLFHFSSVCLLSAHLTLFSVVNSIPSRCNSCSLAFIATVPAGCLYQPASSS